MSVSFNGNIDYKDWQALVNKQQNTYNTTGMDASQIQNVNTIEQSDSFVSSTGEKCTDGKDDGKIGFFSAIGNAVKGVGKTIVNGVKGMFTGKDGKFSLGKTLLSVGTAALCFAVPAVGVAACVIGGTMGALQVGKGIYNAATAETDAEAKEAWQNIGGGAFSVGMSVVGAKAGVKAMQKGASLNGGTSALEALKGTKLTPKTAGAYAKAFLQDGINSGRNNLGQMGRSISSFIKTNKGKLNPETLKEMMKSEKSELRQALKEARKAGDDIKYEEYYNQLQELKSQKPSFIDQAKGEISTIKEFIDQAKLDGASPVDFLKESLSGVPKEILNAISEGKTSYDALVSKYGYADVAEVLELISGFEIASNEI